MARFPFLSLALLPIASACTFQGGGIAPLAPAPAARIAEAELEVPYVATPRAAVEAMLDLARLAPNDYLIDLGSGDGRIPIMAGQRGARALGVDIDPARVAEAELAAQVAMVSDRVRFRRQDLFDTPLAQASVVTLYLLPGVNMRLRPRLLTELRPGSRVVSHNFTLGDWAPDAQRTVGASTVHLWIVPAPVEGEWRLDLADGRSLPLRLEQRFQQVSGTLGDRELEDVRLEGRSLGFTGQLPEGPVRFEALVGDRDMRPDPDRPAAGGWQATRRDP